MRALLISTYDLGRQPLGLASPAGRLRKAGVEVACVDTSRQPLEDAQIAEAELIAFYLPMHTATRLAGPILDRVRQLNPGATVAAYGLYAPLNRQWLNERGVRHVLGPEDESELATLACRGGVGHDGTHGRSRAADVLPDRSGLLPLDQYAALQMPDGSRRVTGSTDATRGCKHLCRHCPIVPVYHGRFRAIAIADVMADVHSQVAQGAQHITFGDPDFLNGPTHARRLIEQLHGAFPSLTYDVTIKISHLLKHCDLLPMFRETGCLFITSAVESVDDAVLEQLRKGHTRKDFEQALTLCREAGVTLSPTFVAFTPWTTPDSYLDLLDAVRTLDLVEQVAPIQLAIRLLVTAESPLLELDDVRTVAGSFDAASLTWPWHHRDPVVDALHRDVMRIVAAGASTPRADVFAAIAERASALAGRPAPPPVRRRGLRPPMLTEPWYCCAEPVESHL
jgi:radical SAM family protein